MQAFEKTRSRRRKTGWIAFQQCYPLGISAETTHCGSGGSETPLSSTVAGEPESLLRRLILLFGALLCLGLLAATSPASAHVRINSISHAVLTAKGDTLNYYLDLPPTVLKLLRDNIGDNTSDLTDYFGPFNRCGEQDAIHVN